MSIPSDTKIEKKEGNGLFNHPGRLCITIAVNVHDILSLPKNIYEIS